MVKNKFKVSEKIQKMPYLLEVVAEPLLEELGILLKKC